ncbi:uncharacterized protein Dwil_GK27837, partial [Drosophila willistoni]
QQPHGIYPSYELTTWLNRVLEAISLSINRLSEKVRIATEFEVFNRERRDLEQQINDRIYLITDHLLLESKRKGKCRRFYERQRDALRSALKQSNRKKKENLKKHSSDCSQRRS